MQILRHPDHLPRKLRNGVVALGNFDGFHRGHQAVVGEAGRVARASGRRLVVLVTEPHPRSFFQLDSLPFRLTGFRERAELLEIFGVDINVVLPFDEFLAGTSPKSFAEGVLVKGLGSSHVVVGYDYRFGKGRSGDAQTLQEFGQKLGFGVSVIDAVTFGVEGAAGEVYSSSRVREALRKGEARLAAALLGHWWWLSGRVVEGERRGRKLGFPTANLEFHDSLVPKHGVYAVRLLTGEGSTEIMEGVANIGTRPTFSGKKERLEVHVFDFDGDLYDQHVRVELVGFLRAERKFAGLDRLREQINLDIAACKVMLADPENRRDRLMPLTLDEYLASNPSAAT